MVQVHGHVGVGTSRRGVHPDPLNTRSVVGTPSATRRRGYFPIEQTALKFHISSSRILLITVLISPTERKDEKRAEYARHVLLRAAHRAGIDRVITSAHKISDTRGREDVPALAWLLHRGRFGTTDFRPESADSRWADLDELWLILGGGVSA